MMREYDEALDGDLIRLGSCFWQGATSGLFFWHDESEQLSRSYESLDVAKDHCKRYCREVLGASV